MKSLRCALTLSMVAILSTSAWGAGDKYLLYRATPVDKAKVAGEGILVKWLVIKKGDCLTKISHKQLGKASYYPQILLFNHIKNPDLIYAGGKLQVPVKSTVGTGKKKELKAAKREAEARPEGVETGRREVTPQEVVRPQPVTPEPVVKPQTEVRPEGEGAPSPAVQPEATPKTAAPVPPIEPLTEEQSAYQAARKAYLDGDYLAATNLLGAFLDKYPNSPLAPDAALYKADAYLRMSEH